MKTIPLTRGKFAIVDDSDLEWLSQWKWCVQDRNKYTSYAIRGFHLNGKLVGVRMHRVIMGAEPGQQVDHKNGNGLDNRRSNLRIASHSQNGANRRRQRNNTSGFPGVSWHIRRKKWQVRIKVNQKQIYLGIFDDLSTAVAKYNNTARDLFGDFKWLDERGDGLPDDAFSDRLERTEDSLMQ